MPPTVYLAMANEPMGYGQFVEVAYGRGSILGNAFFQIRYVAGGASRQVQSMRTGEGRGSVRTDATSAVRSGRIPQAVSFGPAQLTVTRFDRETKDATVRYDRDFSLTPVSFTYPPETMYIYVPG